MRVTKLIFAVALFALVASSGPWVSKSSARTKADNDTTKRLNAAADVLSEIMGASSTCKICSTRQPAL